MTSAFVVVMLTASTPVWAQSQGKTFTVKFTTDNPDAHPGDGKCDVFDIPGIEACTLRAAIEETNANNNAPAVDTIKFDISGSDFVNTCSSATGMCTISPTSALPQIREALTIYGYTQPGASPNTLAVGDNAKLLVELNRTNAGVGTSGLIIQADNAVVKGLALNRFGGAGIVVGDDFVFDKVEGNFIGTDPSGTQARGNVGDGVTLVGDNSTIGGTLPAQRNIISSNAGNGVGNTNGSPGLNQVVGNFIGTDKDGIHSLRNLGSGVFFFIGNGGNTVGGTTSGAANTIAFNGGDGVTLVDSFNTANSILSNSIFSNADLGIDLNDDGVTNNDFGPPPDEDTSPNNRQNFPDLTSAHRNSAEEEKEEKEKDDSNTADHHQWHSGLYPARASPCSSSPTLPATPTRARPS